MSQPSTGQVFMSYSRRDELVMRRIAIFLRNQGFEVWVDNENLTPGTPVWEEEIEKAIKNAYAVVVVLSPDAKNSEWVRREITYADQYERRVFPILASGDEDSSIPLRLITRQFVDVRINENMGLNSLCEAISLYREGLEAQEGKETQKVERKNLREPQRLSARTKDKHPVRKTAVKDGKSPQSALVAIGVFVGIALTVIFICGFAVTQFLPSLLSPPIETTAFPPSSMPTDSFAPPSATPHTDSSLPTRTQLPEVAPPATPFPPTQTLDPVYSRNDRISGVFTYRGDPVEGIPVGLIADPNCDSGKVIQKTVTDSQGRYYFLDVAPGSYTITINGWNNTDIPLTNYEQTCTWELEKKADEGLPLDWSLHKTDLQIIYPTDYSSVGSVTPTLQWQPYPAATLYEIIIIQTSPTRQSIVWLDPTENTSYTPTIPLTPGAEYQLLVWAKDNTGQIAVGSVYFYVQ